MPSQLKHRCIIAVTLHYSYLLPARLNYVDNAGFNSMLSQSIIKSIKTDEEFHTRMWHIGKYLKLELNDRIIRRTALPPALLKLHGFFVRAVESIHNIYYYSELFCVRMYICLWWQVRQAPFADPSLHIICIGIAQPRANLTKTKQKVDIIKLRIAIGIACAFFLSFNSFFSVSCVPSHRTTISGGKRSFVAHATMPILQYKQSIHKCTCNINTDLCRFRSHASAPFNILQTKKKVSLIIIEFYIRSMRYLIWIKSLFVGRQKNFRN